MFQLEIHAYYLLAFARDRKSLEKKLPPKQRKLRDPQYLKDDEGRFQVYHRVLLNKRRNPLNKSTYLRKKW